MSEPQEPRAGNGEPLSRRRPEPPRQFQDNLRRHLLELYARERRPVYLWARSVPTPRLGSSCSWLRLSRWGHEAQAFAELCRGSEIRPYEDSGTR